LARELEPPIVWATNPELSEEITERRIKDNWSLVPEQDKLADWPSVVI
jgi:hypothetical protein